MGPIEKKHDVMSGTGGGQREDGYRVPPSLEQRFVLLNSHGNLNGGYDPQLKVTVISYNLPRFDKASSEFRLHKIIQILLDNNCRVDYFYGASTSDDARYKQSFSGPINFIHQPFDLATYLRDISVSNPNFICISQSR